MKHFAILGLSILSCSLLMADEEVVLMTRGRNKSSKNPPTTAATVCPKAGPYVSMEYLYWKPFQEQLNFCALVTGRGVSDGGPGEITIVPQTLKFEHTSGFRAALGYDFHYEKYDTCFAWTYFHPTAKRHISQSDHVIFFAFPFGGLTDSDVPNAASSTSKWRMAFDMFDFEFARKFTVGKRFTIRPLIGVKGGWINQSQYASYKNIPLGASSNIIEIVQGTFKRKNNFHGMGPRLGADLRYGFGREFGVFGTFSGAALYGHLDATTTIFLTDTLTNSGAAGNGAKTYTYSYGYSPLRTTAQLLVGVDWAKCLFQKWQIRLSAAYEAQIWWNQFLALGDFSEEVNSIYGYADLWMQGLTVQARFDF
jgi:hypothetical protein